MHMLEYRWFSLLRLGMLTGQYDEDLGLVKCLSNPNDLE